MVTPRIIGNFKKVDVNNIVKYLLSSIKNVEPHSRFRDGSVYNVDEGDDVGCVVLSYQGVILYFVHHIQVDPDNSGRHNVGRKIMVWRKRHMDYERIVTGFAHHVFFNILLPHYSTLAADRHQTKYGRLFWVNMIVEALGSDKYHVYIVDHRQGSTLVKVRDRSHFHTLSEKIWGTADPFQKIIPVISLKPLAAQM